MFTQKNLSRSLRLVVMTLASLILTTGAIWAQNVKVSGTVSDVNGEPLIGAYVLLQGTTQGTSTDIDGKYVIDVPANGTLVFQLMGMQEVAVPVNNRNVINVTMEEDAMMLEDVVVTALGIKREKKALGYAIEDVGAKELMRNKSANAINSLAGKIAGVNVTQGGGAAGGGSQIILRGGTSLERDNQPLFVVDGVIYDNSTTVPGNSAFDGSISTASTTANRVMDINPEDIENMSVLKGPAAAALYGSRAAAGVVIITTKKGKEGAVEVNVSSKYISQWAQHLPEVQTSYRRGFMEDVYDSATGNLAGTVFNDFSYNSWGSKIGSGDKIYDNIGNFFQPGNAWDNSVSIAGGTQNSNFYLSGSYYDQTGIIPTTGYTKSTVRFNGEQKWKLFTFGANVAYSQANTDKTLTSAGLYGSSGSGTMTSVYRWAPTDDMEHYMNEDGTRYRMFGDRLDIVDERDNPYWILNKNKLQDQTERITGNFSVKADLADWWWISFRMGIDSYTTDDSKKIGAGGVYKPAWQKGMYSENSYRFRYMSTNLMTNFSKSFGDFNFNLMGGLATDDTRTWSNSRMAWNFEVADFYSFDNATDANRDFSSSRSQKRLIGLYGEFRADWKNTAFVTVSARNDWSSTLPLDNRSYFYPAVSAALVVTELFDELPSWLTYAKVRGSWARVGKDTSPYDLETALWPSQEFLGGLSGVSNYWQSGNAYLKPEITESIEAGLEMRFFNSRLKFDFAYYTNNSINQIMSPRLSNATGYILRKVNAGDVYNKGMELSIGAIPVETKTWNWETSVNFSGNRGTVKNLLEGVEILYVTDVQVGNAKAASFPNGNFMAISGSEWQRDDQGRVKLDKNGMPTLGTNSQLEIGNREPKFQGGFNNTITFKDWSFNMLWDFRVGGHVYNGTLYAMTGAGTSKLSENRERIEVQGVNTSGEFVTNVFEAGNTYMYNGKPTSGTTIIANYWQSIYPNESSHFMTEVNALRLRSLSLSYSLPKTVLNKLKVLKRATFTATANNLLLFTNYDGDPEVAAAGSGAVGSSSVGIDYCGVPSTGSFSFGINLTF